MTNTELEIIDLYSRGFSIGKIRKIIKGKYYHSLRILGVVIKSEMIYKDGFVIIESKINYNVKIVGWEKMYKNLKT